MLLWVAALLFYSGDVQLSHYQGGGLVTTGDVVRTTIYITMPDGVRLAGDLYLPPEAKKGAKLPAILQQTRYWRRSAKDQSIPFGANYFASRGYAYLYMDVRGTGASFGTRTTPFDAKEVEDGKHIVDWIVNQTWSNGKVGATGVSYEANTAAFLAVHNHPAVGLVVPVCFDDNVYRDLLWPGGVYNEKMGSAWGQFVAALDRNKGPGGSVAPVEGFKADLKKAVAEHRTNINVAEAAANIQWSDQAFGSGKASDLNFTSYNDAFQKTDTFFYLWGSWMDAGTAQGVLRVLTRKDQNVRVVIGPWDHGGGNHASPFLDPEMHTTPTPIDQVHDHLKGFNHFLKGEANGFEKEPRIYYYTMGEERWHGADQWPPHPMTPQRFYLQDQKGLGEKPGSGKDVYDVDFTTTTGVSNRWATQFGGGDVIYPDRAEADRKNLVYTSQPFKESVEITGFPVLNLQMASSTEDGALFAYLEDVAPDGRVTYITEGLLRLVFHKNQGTDPLLNIPHRTYREADAAPMPQDQVTDVSFALFPTSVVIRQGHALRISLAGADSDHFKRYPAVGASTWTIDRASSYLEVPVRPRPDITGDHPLSAKAGVYETETGHRIEVTAKNGGLVMTAWGQQAFNALRPHEGLDADKWRKRVEQILERTRDRDWAYFDQDQHHPRTLAALKDGAKMVRKSAGWEHLGVYYERGFYRAYVNLKTRKGAVMIGFYFDSGTQRLEYILDSQPPPVQSPLFTKDGRHFTTHGLHDLNVTFQKDVMILNGQEWVRAGGR